MAGENQHELVNLVRECVRSEIELRSSGREGNLYLLARTRDLIAGSARSASRDVANSLSPAASNGSTQSVFSSSPGISTGLSGNYSVGRSTTVVTSAKRPATSQHPWCLKKGKQKKLQQEFYPKAVHLLDKPADQHQGPANYISDYSIKDDMTLLKCYIEIGTLQTEAEIRESITEVKCCILTSVLYYMYMTLASYSFLKLGKTHVSGLILE